MLRECTCARVYRYAEIYADMQSDDRYRGKGEEI